MVRLLVATSFAVLALRTSAEAMTEACVDGECMTEENSLLALKTESTAMKAEHRNLTQYLKSWAVKTCFNRKGHPFPCGDGECCGDVCKAEGDLCCKNSNGNFFPCQAGGSCCGNACAAPGSKCCNVGKPGYEYPVAKGDACTSDYTVTCINSKGNKFQCGKGSSCCGDICVAPGDTCCHSHKHSFACAHGNKCCGNSCQAPGSKCCETRGLAYPVTKDTKCAGWEQGSLTCTNRRGEEFQCGAGSTCCGDICAGAGSACCQNQHGNDFVCAAGMRCGKNVCIS